MEKVAKIDLEVSTGIVPAPAPALPFMFTETGPALNGEKESKESKESIDETIKTLIGFHLFGGNADSYQNNFKTLDLMPALFYQYKDIRYIRNDYPLFLRQETDSFAISLKNILDDLIAGESLSGDEGEIFKKDMLRLESEVRMMAAESRGDNFVEIMRRAIKNKSDESEPALKRRQSVTRALTSLEKKFSHSGELIVCNKDAPGRLTHHAFGFHWREVSSLFRSEIEEICNGLSELLPFDSLNSNGKGSKEGNIQSTEKIFGRDIDLDAVSSLLLESRPVAQIPEARIKRLRSILSTIKSELHYFENETTEIDLREKESTTGSSKMILFSCVDALKEFQARIKSFTQFFRAVRIARLELKNKYIEEKHGDLYQNFSFAHLTAAEIKLIPPMLVHIRDSQLNDAEKNALIEILSSDFPIKILFQSDSLFEAAEFHPGACCFRGMTLNLANIAVSLGSAYVLQSSLSNLKVFIDGLRNGMRYHGPALYSIFTGDNSNYSFRSEYIAAVAAHNSRVFPAFSFDPGKGRDQASRFTVESNADEMRDWPESSFKFQSAAGAETEEKLSFTFVDFLAGDRRFAGHFRPLPPGLDDERLIPLIDYLNKENMVSPQDLEASYSMKAGFKIPYILMINNSGQIRKIGLTREIALAAGKCLQNWKNLQELGGIHNSHVKQQIEMERKRFEEEKKEKIEEIETMYQTQFDRSLEKVTEEVVEKIAAGLLGQGFSAFSGSDNGGGRTAQINAVREGATETVEKGAASQTTTAEAVPDEEEEISFDEAYIETPRCTSCNECTNKNNRMFVYDENKQAYIKDITAGTFRDLVESAELCPVYIIHPGKPKNPEEPGLEELIKRAEKFN